MRSPRQQRRTKGEGNGLAMAVACVALALGLYVAGALVWHLEDEEAAAPETRFTMTVE